MNSNEAILLNFGYPDSHKHLNQNENQVEVYARQVANYPCCVILLVLAVALGAAIVCITVNEAPDFKDPRRGASRCKFRHKTDFSRFDVLVTRLSKYGVIYKKFTFSDNSAPYSIPYPFDEQWLRRNLVSLTISLNLLPGGARGEDGGANDTGRVEDGAAVPWLELEAEEREYGSVRTSQAAEGKVVFERPLHGLTPDRIVVVERKTFFCNNPIRGYAHVVLQSPNGNNLFTVKGLKAICDIDEHKLRASEQFLNSANKPLGKLLPVPTPGVLRTLLPRHEAQPRLCHGACPVPRCATVLYRVRCRLQHSALSHGHPLLDPSSVLVPNLTYTTIFLPTAQSSAALDYYKDLDSMDLYNDEVEVSGMEMGLKYKLFVDCLLHDTVDGLLHVHNHLSNYFFPFINLLTIVIIIGIGADDACIYCKIWSCAKAEKNNGTLVKLVRDTLHHACLSMFVTSVTTAVAFFGSAVSNITAVRCFSIFAGTAVLANFIFTVSWLPASVIMAEKWCSSTCLCIPPVGLYVPQMRHVRWCSIFCSALWKLHYSFNEYSRVFFEKILPCIIVKSRYFWLVLFSAIAAGGAVAVFYYPRLQLPDSKEFQIFNSDHPFERYDQYLKKFFWFEKAKRAICIAKCRYGSSLEYCPKDTGNYLIRTTEGTWCSIPISTSLIPRHKNGCTASA
ncbi:protein dispatched homolog 1 [Caerostris extrusa]|uniref:Protein dispatched homolog 1 n=1 Tax=Caerostris extrusa TaxID=172846 RepID=A0AAV4PQZ8_CAEEX|nr:protein dispatched homolog 1 [Caerostris extrusa]